MLVLLLACALGAGGYWLWPKFQQLQHDTAANQQNLQRLTEQQQQQQDATSQLQQQLQTEQQQRLTQLEQRLQQRLAPQPLGAPAPIDQALEQLRALEDDNMTQLRERMEALREHGACVHHRRSFAPVAQNLRG